MISVLSFLQNNEHILYIQGRMISTSKAEVEAYQSKIAHLQADNIIYAEQIERLRKRLIQLEDYQIRYQLLLEKQVDESPLRRSRRVDELTNMNNKIDQINQNWKERLRQNQDKSSQEIQKLSLLNSSLKTENLKFQEELLSLKRKQNRSNLPESEHSQPISHPQTLIFKIKESERQYHELEEQLLKVRVAAQNRESDMDEEVQKRIEEAKQIQKQFYRQTIQSLESKIEEIREQVKFHEQRASPQRQGEIQRLQDEMDRLVEANTNEIRAINVQIQQKDQDNSSLKRYIENYKSQTQEEIKRLSEELNQTKEKLFNSEKQLHYELIACRQQMRKIREKEVGLLKEQFENIECGFEAERLQWKQMIEDQQIEVERIKSMWESEKEKYLEEKNKLKQKIQELRQRLQRNQEQEKAIADGQTFKMIQSLKKIDDYEDKYNDYENGITFLHRQLKRATAKLQEKSRDSSHLLSELNAQKLGFQAQVESIKESERSQVEYFRKKLLAADQNVSQLLEEIRQKQKYIKSRQDNFKEKYEKLELQNISLKNLLDQMQRDYRRVTDNRQDLYRSYRSERDNVFTGKNELNVERKKKWLELDRQKNELEISYKERQRQIRDTYDLKIRQLQQKLNKKTYENQKNLQQLASFQDKLQAIAANPSSASSPKQTKRAQLKQFNKKVAALDLEVSLTQNLYKTLKNVRTIAQSRKKTTEQSADYYDYGHSQQPRMHTSDPSRDDNSMTSRERKVQQMQQMGLDEDDFVNDNVAPTFSANNKNNKHELSVNLKTGGFNYPEDSLKITFTPQNTFGGQEQQQYSDDDNVSF